MLRNLGIQDFVIVERLELGFSPGFTVLTGETGAGKSILIDALSLVLGERGDVTAVRDGCEKAEISAEFDIHRVSGLAEWLRENDLEGDPGVLLMRRTLDSSGRSRGFVNGRSATLQQMREVGERLVDIHGQHAHQSLLRGDAQRDLLDDFAGQRDLARKVAAAWRDWQAMRARRQELEQNAAAMLAEREDLEWKLKELQALNFSRDEWQTLTSDHARLAHSATLAEGAQAALDALAEAESACLPQVNAIVARLNGLLEYDAALKEQIGILESAQIQLQEAAYGLRHYQERVELEPERLRELEARLSAVHGTARKYRVAPEELPALAERIAARLGQISALADSRELARQEEAARSGYLAAARELGAARRRAARDLTEQVSAAMQGLAMQGGSFAVAFLELPEGNSHGLEHVEFQVAAHAGVPLRPLSRVASGGELSRVSLAIQAITSRVALVPTLIFDEVDAGIGGKVAEIVGRMMRKLGNERQVMCVTHLPQVAAAADSQWKVEKRAADGKVTSRVVPLERAARVEEIARMLGGIKITDTTRRHAAEMLGL
ncbi:MAG TPA: DNA repair protein RecN [Burkholderiales bacterium]|nr:DNA repair protein RecN [Burkholderiales bacterium]